MSNRGFQTDKKKKIENVFTFSSRLTVCPLFHANCSVHLAVYIYIYNVCVK